MLPWYPELHRMSKLQMVAAYVAAALFAEGVAEELVDISTIFREAIVAATFVKGGLHGKSVAIKAGTTGAILVILAAVRRDGQVMKHFKYESVDRHVEELVRKFAGNELGYLPANLLPAGGLPVSAGLNGYVEDAGAAMPESDNHDLAEAFAISPTPRHLGTAAADRDAQTTAGASAAATETDNLGAPVPAMASSRRRPTREQKKPVAVAPISTVADVQDEDPRLGCGDARSTLVRPDRNKQDQELDPGQQLNTE